MTPRYLDFDHRPNREIQPRFDDQAEDLEVRALVALNSDASPEGIVRAAAKLRRMDPVSGELVYILPNGQSAHGTAGRVAAVEQLLEARRLDSFPGGDPATQVRKHLVPLGITEEEAAPYL